MGGGTSGVEPPSSASRSGVTSGVRAAAVTGARAGGGVGAGPGPAGGATAAAVTAACVGHHIHTPVVAHPTPAQGRRGGGGGGGARGAHHARQRPPLGPRGDALESPIDDGGGRRRRGPRASTVATSVCDCWRRAVRRRRGLPRGTACVPAAPAPS